MTDHSQDPAKRPEPERLRGRGHDPQTFAKLAAKAARKVVATRASAKKRASQGMPQGTRAPVSALVEGRRRAPRCTAQTKTGARCALPCVRGSDRCVMHEGVERAPHSPAAGRRYLEGKLRPPANRFKTHPSALAEAGQAPGQAPGQAARKGASNSPRDSEPDD